MLNCNARDNYKIATAGFRVIVFLKRVEIICRFKKTELFQCVRVNDKNYIKKKNNFFNQTTRDTNFVFYPFAIQRNNLNIPMTTCTLMYVGLTEGKQDKF